MTRALSDTRPLVTVIIPHRNTPEHLVSTLASLARDAVGIALEVIVVDNGSTLGRRPARPSRDTESVICNQTNRGFAVACNQGAAAARGELLFFLNSDAEPLGGCLAALVAALAADPGLAAVAAVERLALDGEAASPARRFLGAFDQAFGLSGLPWLRHARDRLALPARAVADAPWVTAAAMLVRTSVFDAVGGFDEGFFFYEEDEDFCWRVRRRGWRLGVCREAVVRHRGGGSVRAAGGWPALTLYAGQLRFIRRRAGRVASFAYRASVAAVATAKVLVRPITRSQSTNRPPLPSLLRLLCIPAAKVSTTGA